MAGLWLKGVAGEGDLEEAVVIVVILELPYKRLLWQRQLLVPWYMRIGKTAGHLEKVEVVAEAEAEPPGDPLHVKSWIQIPYNHPQIMRSPTTDLEDLQNVSA